MTERLGYKRFSDLNPRKETFLPHRLSERYGQTKLILMPIDPRRAFTYWELEPKHPETILLRLLEVPWKVSDTPVQREWKNYYFSVPQPGRVYQVELGVEIPELGWRVFARSNAVRMPFGQPAEEPAVWPEPLKNLWQKWIQENASKALSGSPRPSSLRETP